MLRIIETFGNLPSYYEIDPNTHINPGQVGSLKISRGKALLDICDGINPIGTIDDINSDKIRAVVWDELVIAPNCQIEYDTDKNGLVLSQDVKVELKHKNIIGNSVCIKSPSNIYPIVDGKLGVLTFLKGTLCNCSLPEMKNGVSTIIRYAYNMPHEIKKSSTVGTNQAIVWCKNMIAETDMFDTTQLYPMYSNLYVTNGLWTTAKINYHCKAIGVVLYPPTSENPVLKFLLDPNGNVEIASQ